MYLIMHEFHWDIETIKKIPIPAVWIIADESVKLQARLEKESKRKGGRIK